MWQRLHGGDGRVRGQEAQQQQGQQSGQQPRKQQGEREPSSRGGGGRRGKAAVGTPTTAAGGQGERVVLDVAGRQKRAGADYSWPMHGALYLCDGGGVSRPSRSRAACPASPTLLACVPRQPRPSGRPPWPAAAEGQGPRRRPGRPASTSLARGPPRPAAAGPPRLREVGGGGRGGGAMMEGFLHYLVAGSG